MDKVRMTIYIDKDLHSFIMKYKEKTGKPASYVINRYLRKLKTKLKN